MIKIGDKVEGYTLVVSDSSEGRYGYQFCKDEHGEIIKSGNLDDALNSIDRAMDCGYGGQTVFIMKESLEVVEEVLVPKIDGDGNVEKAS